MQNISRQTRMKCEGIASCVKTYKHLPFKQDHSQLYITASHTTVNRFRYGRPLQNLSLFINITHSIFFLDSDCRNLYWMPQRPSFNTPIAIFFKSGCFLTLKYIHENCLEYSYYIMFVSISKIVTAMLPLSKLVLDKLPTLPNIQIWSCRKLQNFTINTHVLFWIYGYLNILDVPWNLYPWQ